MYAALKQHDTIFDAFKVLGYIIKTHSFSILPLSAAFQPLDICARVEKHSCQNLVALVFNWHLCWTLALLNADGDTRYSWALFICPGYHYEVTICTIIGSAAAGPTNSQHCGGDVETVTQVEPIKTVWASVKRHTHRRTDHTIYSSKFQYR